MTERSFNRALRRYELEDARAWAGVAMDAGHPSVRFLLRQLIEMGNMGGNPFSTDPLTTAFNSGKLSLAQEIFAAIAEEAPHLYPTLLMEIHDDNARRAADLHNRLSDGRDDT